MQHKLRQDMAVAASWALWETPYADVNVLNLARRATYALHHISNNCAYFWVACGSGGTLSMGDARRLVWLQGADARPVGILIKRATVHTSRILPR